jgi:hypothetical protein
MWPLLQCVRLAPPAAHGFIEMILENNGECEKPLLPSLTQLVMVHFSLSSLSLLPLHDALMKRVKEGVPVKVLDLHMCRPHPDNPAEDWLQSLSEIGVDVLRPEKPSDMRVKMESIMWDVIANGPLDYNDDSSEADDDEDDEE